MKKKYFVVSVLCLKQASFIFIGFSADDFWFPSISKEDNESAF